ncbi:MAG: glycosyltransferase 87 family protein [Propioniciclava sp.]|uniref:glycosyltransferase 87 family protein n=1 Tax=Propioniciclava sp. TaxID=2038686 RepID=UPI0039E3F8B2
MLPVLLRPPSRRVHGWLIAWVVIAACAISLGAGSIDLAVYLRAAQAVAAGGDPNLTPPGELPWFYPPFAAALFVPLLALPFPVAAMAMALASAAALARLLHLVMARLGHPELTLVALAGAVVAEPVYATLGYGQVNLMIAWLVAEGFLGRQRWLIGVAAGIKLTPLVFLLPLLVRRDLRGAGLATAGLAGTIGLGWVVAPAASGEFWSGLFLGATERIGTSYAANQSLTGALWRAAGPGGVPLMGAALTVAVVLVGAAVLRRPDIDDILALVVTGIAGLLVSPLSWVHHWIWVLPLVLWSVTNGRRRLALAWSILLVGRVTWWFPSGGEAEYAHGLVGKLTQDSWTILALITLGVLAFARTSVRGVAASGSASGLRGRDECLRISGEGEVAPDRTGGVLGEPALDIGDPRGVAGVRREMSGASVRDAR